MEYFYLFGHHRRPHKPICWQHLREWQLRDIERIRLGGGAGSEQRDRRLWLTARQYNELASIHLMPGTEFDITNASTLFAKERSQPDTQYLAGGARDVRAAWASVAWDAVALGTVCVFLLMFTLTALLETCGYRVVPRRCSKKSRKPEDETSTLESPPLLELPPPYQGYPYPPPIHVQYTPLANECPPPAYSEVFVKLPNTKLVYTDEAPNANTAVTDERSSSSIENGLNDAREDSGNVAKNDEMCQGGSVLV